MVGWVRQLDRNLGANLREEGHLERVGYAFLVVVKIPTSTIDAKALLIFTASIEIKQTELASLQVVLSRLVPFLPLMMSKHPMPTL